MTTDLVLHRRPNALLPQNYAEAIAMATDMAEAKMIPTHFQKARSDCMALIRLGIVWEMDPYMLAQECYSINGKLMPSGKLAAAVINARGNLAERLSYEYSGEGDSRAITVRGRIDGEDKARDVEVKFKDAKTANDQWKKQPDQQLMYSGARTWGRRHVPELLLGVTFYEEADAMAPQPPRVVSDLPKIQGAPPLTGETREVIDHETGEVTEVTGQAPYTIEAKTWAGFMEPMTAAILSCRNFAEYDGWMQANQETLIKLKETKPELYQIFDKSVAAKLTELQGT
jgi:hypothetical protein